MKSTQLGIVVLTPDERERRKERAVAREVKIAEEAVEALAEKLAAQRTANPVLAAIDAEATKVVNLRVMNGGKV